MDASKVPPISRGGRGQIVRGVPPTCLVVASVVSILCVAVAVGAHMARAATEVPAGYAAVVRLGRGQPGRLAMRSFDQRKRQVRAERRVTGVSDGTPVA